MGNSSIPIIKEIPMPTHTVSDDILLSSQAEEYFNRADRRTRAGLRTALELLGLPLPDYAKRRLPGPRAGQGVLAAYHAEHGKPRTYELPARRPPLPSSNARRRTLPFASYIPKAATPPPSPGWPLSIAVSGMMTAAPWNWP